MQLEFDSADELFADIPEQHRNLALDLPPPMSEFDLKRYFAELASMNKTPGEYACFLGAGIVQALHPVNRAPAY